MRASVLSGALEPSAITASSLTGLSEKGSLRLGDALTEGERLGEDAHEGTAPFAPRYRTDSVIQHRRGTAARRVKGDTYSCMTSSAGDCLGYQDQMKERVFLLAYSAELGDDRKAPSHSAISDALRFIDLLPNQSPNISVSVADDGEINFFKREQGVFIDIGFFGDGKIHYYVSVEALGIDRDDSRPFSGNSLPRELVTSITTD